MSAHFIKIAADGSQLSADATGHAAVLDTRTQLMWSAAPSICECANWRDAGKSCTDLELAGFNDWRLPTVEELFLLADRTKYNPAIDVEFFPGTHSSWYWTSTVDCTDAPSEASSGFAWDVHFSGGLPAWRPAWRHDGFVRAVRTAKAVHS